MAGLRLALNAIVRRARPEAGRVVSSTTKSKRDPRAIQAHDHRRCSRPRAPDDHQSVGDLTQAPRSGLQSPHDSLLLTTRKNAVNPVDDLERASMPAPSSNSSNPVRAGRVDVDARCPLRDGPAKWRLA